MDNNTNEFIGTDNGFLEMNDVEEKSDVDEISDLDMDEIVEEKKDMEVETSEQTEKATENVKLDIDDPFDFMYTIKRIVDFTNTQCKKDPEFYKFLKNHDTNNRTPKGYYFSEICKEFFEDLASKKN